MLDGADLPPARLRRAAPPRLFAGQAVSLLGDAAFLTALSWKTFTLAGSARLGLVLLCESAAMTATLLLGGTLADRYPRRRLMILSDLARFVAVGALAGADAAGVLGFPLLLVFATLMGAGDGFFTPAFGGIVPLVVEQPSLASANNLIGLARWGSLLLGSSLAALLYRAAGSATVFSFDAALFVLSAALLWRARPRAFRTAEPSGALREIRQGACYVAGIPWLWVTIALFAVVLMLQLAPQQVLMPKLVAEQWVAASAPTAS